MELKIKTKVQADSNKDVINDIANLLLSNAEKGVITIEQLLKIKNLATSPERLKNALVWL